MRDDHFSSPPGFDIQGHRGARGLAPENTIVAFRRALDLGVTTLELDTVVSADHEVVVSHEPWMSAVTCSHPNGQPVLAEQEHDLLFYQMPYAEIARYGCGRRGHPRFPRQEAQSATKPRLRDVLAFAEIHAREQGRALPHYNVETKSKPEGDGRTHPPPTVFVELLWALVREFQIAERFILQSFDVRTLQVAHDRGLPIRLALLIEQGAGTPAKHLHAGLAALGFVPDIYSPDYRLVTDAAVHLAHAEGMRIIPWTVNEAAAMQHLHALGVDGLITDYPDVAVALFGSGRSTPSMR
ncbi:MAG: glycerophosphodiester phosphodiesterase [Rhodothermaceae bacterium]|nr:glycerophosphodiester phosphodiesterase [Rhodothermaceae bacterium]